MRFLRHLGRLLKDFGQFAWQNKAWWIIPVILGLLLIAGLVVATQTSAPWLYTIF